MWKFFSAILLSMKIDCKHNIIALVFLGHFNCLSIYNHSSRYTRIGFSAAILAAILENMDCAARLCRARAQGDRAYL